MGVGVYPVLEEEIEGVVYETDGKMLARIIDAAEKRADILGVKPLMSFFGVDPEVLTEDFDLEADGTLTEKWFSAEDGLETVKALIKDLTENPEAYFPGGVSERLVEKLSAPILEGAIENLKEMQRVLQAASGRNLKWYLAIDF